MTPCARTVRTKSPCGSNVRRARLTIEHLWEKLGEHIGPERVAMIRGALDTLGGAWAFIVEVQREGEKMLLGLTADTVGAPIFLSPRDVVAAPSFGSTHNMDSFIAGMSGVRLVALMAPFIISVR